MNRRDRENLIRLGRLMEKRHSDKHILKTAKNWVSEAQMIDNVRTTTIVTWTDEERKILRDAEYILREKEHELILFGENHHEAIYNAIEKGEY